MSWNNALTLEIKQLFSSLGQHPGLRFEEWRAWRYGDKNARRRAHYAIERYMKTAEYRTMLERSNTRSKQWRANNRTKYRHQKEAITRQKLQARSAKFISLKCEECGVPVEDNPLHSGPIPKYCGKRCTHRVASRTWWRRKKASMIKKRTHGELRRMGML